MRDEMTITVRPPRLARIECRTMEIGRLIRPTHDRDWRVECTALAGVAALAFMSAHRLPVTEETFDRLTGIIKSEIIPMMDRRLAELISRGPDSPIDLPHKP